jgi:hypothetical protein
MEIKNICRHVLSLLFPMECEDACGAWPPPLPLMPPSLLFPSFLLLTAALLLL